MAGNFLYIIILVIVVFIFLVVPVGIIARMVFNKADESVSIEELAELEDHVKDLLTQLQSTAEKSTSQLDERITKLTELLERADSKIGSLEQSESSVIQSRVAPVNEPPPFKKAGPAIKETVPGDNTNENKDVFDKIGEMALAGIKIEDIAKELNMHSGEIQLMLGLRGLQAGNNSKSTQSKSGN